MTRSCTCPRLSPVWPRKLVFMSLLNRAGCPRVAAEPWAADEVPGPPCEVNVDESGRDCGLIGLSVSCAEAVPATKAVVRQSAQALRIDRFMFTLLANFVKVPTASGDAAGVSLARRWNLMRSKSSASCGREILRSVHARRMTSARNPEMSSVAARWISFSRRGLSPACPGRRAAFRR